MLTNNIDFLYKLKIQSPINEITITNINKESFLALDFDISKEPTGLNNAKISITNLNPNTSVMFLKSTADITKINIFLDLGILNKGGMGRVFKGTVREASIEKNNTEEVFNIEAFDGGYEVENAIANLKISEGTTFLDIKKQLADRMGLPYVDQGNTEDFLKIQKDLFIDTKNVWSEIQNMFNYQEVYIDNEKLTTLNFDKLKQQKISNFTTISKITDKQFIERPKPQGIYIQCKTELMQFRTKNDLIALESEHPVSRKYNGIYRVIGLVHSGFISKTTISNKPSTHFTLSKII